MSIDVTPEALYETYRDPVARYIGARVQNPYDREDLLQQVFLNAIAALDRYDPSRAAPGTWIYTITRNTVIDYYRKQEREPVPAELEDSTLYEAEADARLLTEETLEALAEALEQLSKRERDIIILRFYHGLSAQETAKRVGVSYANVRYLQYAALKKLRRCLEQPETTLVRFK